jgi:hypothetical protein
MKGGFMNSNKTINVLDMIKNNKVILQSNYGVKKIGLFGSYIKNTQSKKSDIDILVEFNKDIDLFDFLDVKDFLEKLLNRRVDLVMKSALKPNIKKHILNEVQYV